MTGIVSVYKAEQSPYHGCYPPSITAMITMITPPESALLTRKAWGRVKVMAPLEDF